MSLNVLVSSLFVLQPYWMLDKYRLNCKIFFQTEVRRCPSLECRSRNSIGLFCHLNPFLFPTVSHRRNHSTVNHRHAAVPPPSFSSVSVSDAADL